MQGFSARQKLKKGSAGLEDDWVDSNLVYQEYIKDRHHIHLSATRWKSVAGLVRFLGQKGIAEVKRKKVNSASHNNDYEDKYIFGGDQSNGLETESESESESEEQMEEAFEKDPTKRPKWFIKLIDKSPEAILAAKSKAASLKKSSEEETLQLRQMSSVEKRAAASTTTKQTSLLPIIINSKLEQKTSKVASIFEESSSSDDDRRPAAKIQKKNPVLEEIAAEEIKFKKENRIPESCTPVSYFSSVPIEISVDQDEEDEIAWIRRGLLIKIGNESIGNGKYFGLLAVIDEVIDEFGAQVTVLKSGDQLLLDQDDCLPISRVKDEEFDQQLSTIDPKIMSTALKTDKCILLSPFGFKGKEGRVISVGGGGSGGAGGSQEFKVEISAAGSSQIHRRQFNLNEGQFCIYWE